MNMPDLSLAYRLIKEIAGVNYPQNDLDELAVDEATASPNLRMQCERFHEMVQATEVVIASGEEEAIVSALMHLRICVMGIGSKFDNLADTIGHLFERGVFGKDVEKGGNEG